MKRSMIFACLKDSFRDNQKNHIELRILGHKKENIFWNCPEDIKYFKERTLGLPVIYGYNTFKSLSCQPLPNRTNIIVTRRMGTVHSKKNLNLYYVNSVKDAESLAIELAWESGLEEIIYAGGRQIYNYVFRNNMIDHAYITDIYIEDWPEKFDLSVWEDDHEFSYRSPNLLKFRHAFDPTKWNCKEINKITTNDYILSFKEYIRQDFNKKRGVD